MSLRDRWRQRHDGDDSGDDSRDDSTNDGDDSTGGDSGTGGGSPTPASAGSRSRRASGAPRDDVTDFDPRSDGDYHCVERGLYLRFARPAVMETDSAYSEADTDTHPEEHSEPARGEFTQSGRFVVQRRFARPVVYTVLQVRSRSLTVRRTDTADASTAELVFDFEPDGPEAD